MGTNSVDVMGTATQLRGKTAVLSLNEVAGEDDGGADIFELQDVIANDHEDPATIAARKIDRLHFSGPVHELVLRHG